MNCMIYEKLIEPSGEQITEIIDGLNSFGLAQIGGEAPARVAVVCRGEDHGLVGGAIGHTLRQRFYLTQLWVTEGYRSKGIGSGLLAQMESIAREHECRDIVVDTLNKAAVSFYEHLEYSLYMVIPNYIQGFDWHFMSKEIGASKSVHQPSSD